MADSNVDTAPPAPAQSAGSGMYVVGVGASTGGLAALQVLLGTMPPNPGFACVVVVHLSPEHESHLPELLQSQTSLRVRQVTATIALEPDHVYVIPPNANLDTIDTHLRLTQLEERRSERAPIDHFLRTLAATHNGTSIGVILTGAGSDGSLGLRYIRECGGLTIAQEPEEAEVDAMPRSAIASGMVDLVLPLRRIAAEILQFCGTHPQLPAPDAEGELDAHDAAILHEIFAELRKRTQLDLRVYRRPTLLRRLRRRMQLRNVTSLEAYLDQLVQRNKEAEALANDLALTPTEFFRDADTFLYLREQVVPRIFDSKGPSGARIRVWSIGCSTGEEAYSLAVLLAEERGRRHAKSHVQVFATDASEKGLGAARQGIYPHEIAATVSAERLERFFTAQGGFYRVRRDLQDIVLFATHNVFVDPPFGHIDLIVCRTMLRDLQPEVRRGVLSLFHYALEPDGLLVVGPDDEVDVPGLFEVEDARSRVYRRITGSTSRYPLPPSMHPFGPGAAPERLQSLPVLPVTDIASAYRAAMEHYSPSGVLINSANDVVHFSANSGQYMHIPGGEFTRDLTRLVREPLRARLLEALAHVRSQLKPWNSPPISGNSEHGASQVVLRLAPVSGGELILVVFDDLGSPPAHAKSAAEATRTIELMEAELRRLQTQLLGALEQHPADGNKTSITRQQVQKATEELHSVLEELSTSKEELQAVNEELIALDDENRRRVQELTQISTDLQHLLASTGVATLFINRALQIVRFTPLFGELFGLRISDVGRQVTDFSRLVASEGLVADIHRVLQHLEKIDTEICSEDGQWYLSRLLPYRTESNSVDGVVLTLIDITERKRAELALRETNRNKDEFLALLAHELRNPLAPISSGVEVLKAAPTDTRLVERMAATMERQTRQLVRLVDDLLEVSRISGGKLRLRTTIVDLSEIVQDAIASIKPSLERAGHTLSVELATQPMRVDGDPARLTQIVSNLLSNAVRYTPRGGTIWLTARQDGEAVVLSVKDNGVGIPPEALNHVFDMFYQGRIARPGYSAGLGIGLTLAKTLVEMHQGTIRVASDGEDGGSEFTIRLPLAVGAEAPAPIPERPAHSARNGSEHRILIVDDNVDAAETLCMLMKSLGESEVHTASSGSQALQTADQLHPDIVLLDLMMPEMDGYEVARRIRKEPWGKDLLLVALSGWGHEEHRRRSREAGFDQHVTKPADIVALQAVLDGRRASA